MGLARVVSLTVGEQDLIRRIILEAATRAMRRAHAYSRLPDSGKRAAVSKKLKAENNRDYARLKSFSPMGLKGYRQCTVLSIIDEGDESSCSRFGCLRTTVRFAGHARVRHSDIREATRFAHALRGVTSSTS